MKIAFGFSSDFFEDDDDLQSLAESTVESPKIIIEWDYPLLPGVGDNVDIELLSSFPEIPRPFIERNLSYEVNYIFWGVHEKKTYPFNSA